MAKAKSDKKTPRPAEDRDEARVFRETLDANRQIAHKPGPMPPGTTHRIETDSRGRKQLKRKRFSAL